MSKTTIVTGASRGIGHETSLALANQGHQVVALARSEERLQQLESKAPSQITTYPVDLTNESQVQQFVTWLGDHYDVVDILINNAGSLVNKPFAQLTNRDWKEMIDANLISNVLLTRSLLPFFSSQAHIINISSMGGFQGSAKFPGLSAYSVAKGAVSILSECLAVELSERNIKVNALCLGAVQTEMLEQAFPGFDAPVSADEMGTYIADFAVKASSFYNGQILPVTLSNPG